LLSGNDLNLSARVAAWMRDSPSIRFMSNPPRYSFGPFLFDAKERVLYRESQDVGLPPKAAETLALLLAHAGAVVEKRALLDAAWAGMVVGEGSLTRTISILRKALGGDANSDAWLSLSIARHLRGIPARQGSAIHRRAAIRLLQHQSFRVVFQ
jgi:DNA-binding response OmpR family regulator